MGLILFLIVLIFLFGGGGFYAGPPFHYYGGGLSLILVIVIVVMLFRRWRYPHERTSGCGYKTVVPVPGPESIHARFSPSPDLIS
jgi:hypothetical protein